MSETQQQEILEPVLNDLYANGGYLKKHPTWHVEQSAWKADHVRRILQKNNINPKSVCEIGCGAGEILRQLQLKMDPDCTFWGYDISPQAYELSSERENERLHFTLGDFRKETDKYYDLLMVMDVFEHVDDYIGMLRNIRTKGTYKVFHLTLSISLQTVLRKNGLMSHHDVYGMVHHFSKDTFLQTMRDAGYEILDTQYTASSIELSSNEFKHNLAKLPRRLLYAINKDFAARTIGGLRLLVLAK